MSDIYSRDIRQAELAAEAAEDKALREAGMYRNKVTGEVESLPYVPGTRIPRQPDQSILLQRISALESSNRYLSDWCERLDSRLSGAGDGFERLDKRLAAVEDTLRSIPDADDEDSALKFAWAEEADDGLSGMLAPRTHGECTPECRHGENGER